MGVGAGGMRVLDPFVIGVGVLFFAVDELYMRAARRCAVCSFHWAPCASRGVASQRRAEGRIYGPTSWTSWASCTGGATFADAKWAQGTEWLGTVLGERRSMLVQMNSLSGGLPRSLECDCR